MFVASILDGKVIGTIIRDNSEARQSRPWKVTTKGSLQIQWAKTLNEARRMLSNRTPTVSRQQTFRPRPIAPAFRKATAA